MFKMTNLISCDKVYHSNTYTFIFYEKKKFKK